MLTFTASRGQIPVAIVRNNYLNNWAFKEKIDCLKAVFCGESIRGNHFFWLLDIVFLLISTRRDAWFFGFSLLCRWPVWWTVLRGEKSSDEQFRFNLWFTVAIYIYISQGKISFSSSKCVQFCRMWCLDCVHNSVASSLYSLSLISTYSVQARHTARRGCWRLSPRQAAQRRRSLIHSRPRGSSGRSCPVILNLILFWGI